MAVEKLAQVWPEWKVEKQLGKGSYGVVYKVVREDNHIKSHAAVKVITIPTDESEIDSLRSEGLSEEGAKTYFQGIVNDFVGEIRLMDSLKGVQNIVSVEDYKVVENAQGIGWDIFIRMELLTPFNNYICNKQMTESDVIKLGVDICTALEICGQRDIVHRDIKPENIFINDFGYFKLGDFGIARKLENATGGMSQKGTFNYMAPEVATGTSYDARVDIYSLGIVLYRLLNGNRLPFIENEKQLQNPNERKNAVERRIRGEKMPPPSQASAQVAAVIMRACAYNPQQRFATATQMKEALIRASMGAYTEQEADLDKTISVRHAPEDVNATVRVNRAPERNVGSNNTYRPINQGVGVNTAGQGFGFHTNTGSRTNASGAFSATNTGSRTNDSGSFGGTMGRTGTVTLSTTKKLSILCLLSLISCALPLLLELIAEVGGMKDVYLVFLGIELIIALVPLLLAGLGFTSANKHDMKGKPLAIVAILVDALLVWFIADSYFTNYNKAYLGDSGVAAALHVAYFAVFAILALLVLLKSGKKKS